MEKKKIVKRLLLNNSFLITKILLVIAILVFLLLAFFSQPAADDYGQIQRIQSTSFWNAQAVLYNHINGRFFYMFAFSIYTMIFGLSNYWIFTWLIYGSLFLSICLLISTSGSGLLHRRTLIWSSLTFLLIYVGRVILLSEAFYWLAGAMTYQLGNILFILFIAMLYLLFRASSPYKRLIYTTIGGLLGSFTVATNEIFLVPVFAGLILCMLSLVINKNPSFFYVLSIFLLSCISAYFVITAPGTHIRSLNFPNRHQIGFSLSSSFIYAFRFFRQWAFDPIVLSSTLLFLPSASQFTNQIKISKKGKKILPFLPVAWLFIFTFSFFPAFWALGNAPPDRTLNSIFLFFLLGWYPSVCILTILLLPRQKPDTILPQHIRNAAMIIFLLSLFCFPNLSTAIKDLLFHAHPYHQEVKQRIESTQKSVSENRGYVIIHPLKNRPVSLFSPNFEFRGNPDHWVDYDWELYWGVKVIYQDESDVQ
ncbi:hypothetical protein JW824_13140 [bacterium]|nr:hypothetical protein [bacterium]